MLGQRQELLGCAGDPNASTCENHWPARVEQQIRYTIDVNVRVRGYRGRIAWFDTTLSRRSLDVQRKFHPYGSGTTTTRNSNGVIELLVDRCRVGDRDRKLGQGLHHRCDIHLLETELSNGPLAFGVGQFELSRQEQAWR